MHDDSGWQRARTAGKVGKRTGRLRESIRTAAQGTEEAWTTSPGSEVLVAQSNASPIEDISVSLVLSAREDQIVETRGSAGSLSRRRESWSEVRLDHSPSSSLSRPPFSSLFKTFLFSPVHNSIAFHLSPHFFRSLSSKPPLLEVRRPRPRPHIAPRVLAAR